MLCLSDDEKRKIDDNRREENEFRKALTNLLSGNGRLSSAPLLIGVTPNAIDCCIETKGLNLVITKSVIDKCMRKETRDENGKQQKNSGHGLTAQKLIDVVWAIKRPVMILQGSQPDTLAVMTDLKDNEGRYIFAFLALDKAGTTVNVNMISSAYGRNNLSEYINKCINNDMLIAVNTEKADEVLLSIGGHFSKAMAPINFDNTIAYTLKSVNKIR